MKRFKGKEIEIDNMTMIIVATVVGIIVSIAVAVYWTPFAYFCIFASGMQIGRVIFGFDSLMLTFLSGLASMVLALILSIGLAPWLSMVFFLIGAYVSLMSSKEFKNGVAIMKEAAKGEKKD